MPTLFDRDVFFDSVREDPFSGSLSQDQVDGMNAILDAWEANPRSEDLRHLAYSLATTYHETSQKMQPIEEYGQGAGMSYGAPDPETGQTYFGRGYVQLTWRDNYRRADEELDLGDCAADETSCEWHAENALDPTIAADVMFQGMTEGWFRSSGGQRETLSRYFNDNCDDAYNAREIINGDKSKVPDWSNGVSIGKLIAGYHRDFLAALEAAAEAYEPEPAPCPEPEPDDDDTLETVVLDFTLTITGRNIRVAVEPVDLPSIQEPIMPSKSAKQARTMQGAAHDKDFAERVGIPQKVAQEFVKQDRKKGEPKSVGKKK